MEDLKKPGQTTAEALSAAIPEEIDLKELLSSGATLLGRVVILSEQQLQALPADTTVINLATEQLLKVEDLEGSERFAGFELPDSLSLSTLCGELDISRVKLVALTGSIGSGKSTTASIFKELGAIVFDSDRFARDVVQPGTEGLKEVEAAFGSEVISEDGTLNRKALGKIVFSDPKKKAVLEAILHPKIRETYLSQVLAEVHKDSQQDRLIVYEVPLLYESGRRFPEIEETIAITLPDQTAIDRVVSSRDITREQATMRIETQMPGEDKAARADNVIENSGTLEELREKVKALYLNLIGSTQS